MSLTQIAGLSCQETVTTLNTGHHLTANAVLHSLQRRHFTHHQLHRDGRKHFQIEMIGQLNFPYMLLTDVTKLTQLFAVGAFHDGSLKDASDMLMMGNYRVIVTIFKKLDGFSIATVYLLSVPAVESRAYM